MSAVIRDQKLLIIFLLKISRFSFRRFTTNIAVLLTLLRHRMTILLHCLSYRVILSLKRYDRDFLTNANSYVVDTSKYVTSGLNASNMAKLIRVEKLNLEIRRKKLLIRHKRGKKDKSYSKCY